MKQWFKEIWKDPVWSKVIATAIITVLGFAISFVWSLVSDGKPLQETLEYVLALQVNVWIAVLIVLVILVILGIIQRITQNAKRIPLPPFVNDFTQGLFQGQRWQWRWQWSEENRFYYIDDLSVLCPVCKQGLLTISYMNYRCGNCGADIPYSMLNTNGKAVEKQILEVARTRYNYCAEYIGKLPSGVLNE